MGIRIGIMGAMPEEVEGLLPHLKNQTTQTIGLRDYVCGTLSGIEVVIVFSRWGKVAAASTTATLIHQFHITHLIFSGVAGALSDSLKLADVIIAESLVQHDLDARPFMPKYEIPLLGITHIQSNSNLNHLLENACQTLQYQYHKGLVASGDQFFRSNEQKQAVTNDFPNVLCVEMEGAAAGQVCFEHQIPFSVIRIISDTANETAAHDFQEFIRNVSAVKLNHLIQEVCNCLQLDSSSI
jgi:adenosylhomocysteine nucleosidase